MFAVGNYIFWMVYNDIFPVGLFTFMLIMNSVDFLGYAASAIISPAFLPQVIKNWKEKPARNISLMMLLIAAVNEVMRTA